MTTDRKRILDMLAEGKISVDEAERLLFLVDQPSKEDTESPHVDGPRRRQPPRYLRVVVESGANGESEPGHERVNVRVPVALIRAGMRLPAMMPPGVADKVNQALKENGIDMDVRKIKGDELDELIEALNDLEVDVQDGSQRVRVYAE
jgi:hypothetical protein